MALLKALGYMVVLLVIHYTVKNWGYRETLNVFFEELMGSTHTQARVKREVTLSVSTVSTSSSDYVLQVVINISDPEHLQTVLGQLSYPVTLMINSTPMALITGINTTTVCSPNMTAYQCRCEENYVWSSNNCMDHNACDAIIDDTCGCINAFPTDNQYCQLSTGQTDPVDIDLVLDLRIPLSSVSSNLIHQFRDRVRNFRLPYNISQSLTILDLNFTTWCSPNSTGGLQCECEEQFAWSCDKCDIYGACSNATSRTCSCINGLPSDGEFCEPLTNVAQCPTPTPETTSPTPSPSPSPTPSPTSTPTPTNDPVDIDLVLDLRIPLSSVSSNLIHQFRDRVRNFRLPYNISQSLTILDLNFTTWCSPNSTGGLQCECEEQFAWSCDKCDIYGACSNATSRTCSCINGLPSDGEFCEPLTSAEECGVLINLKFCSTDVAQCPNPTPVMTTTPVPTTAPMNATTTPVITTTTPMTTTTTPVFTTTPMTTTTTPVSTTTPIITTTTATEERALSFTMDISFDSSFNDPNHSLYQDTLNAITSTSQENIPTFKAVKIKFRSGSTICDYNISATSFEEPQIQAVKAGVFKELSKKYPVRFDSEDPLEFDPDPVVFRERVTVRCGPPPDNINFGINWEAKWRLNSSEIRMDEQHTFLEQDGASILNVLQYFSTDKGRYECTLKRGDNSTFRQIKELSDTFNPPLIKVKPVTKQVKCEAGNEQQLECSVNSPYEVEFIEFPNTEAGEKITPLFTMSDSDCEMQKKTFTCRVKNHVNTTEIITLMLFTGTDFDCEDETFGVGNRGDTATSPCEEENKEGEVIAECLQNGLWGNRQENCILQPVKELLDQSQFLTENSLPVFLDQLSNVTTNFKEEVVESPADISAIVDILNNVANASLFRRLPINEILMTDVLLTVGILTSDESRESWNFLNTNDIRDISEKKTSPTASSVSSGLLQSLEDITKALTNDSFNIDTPFILLNKTTFTDTFNADIEFLDSAVETDIPESDGENKSITVITFASMENVLPARDENNSTSKSINGRVVLVYSNGTVNNVSFTFDILNDTLKKPQCVFWNFSLFDGLGGWDDEGCELVDENNTVTCNCNHLTSFSILMSPFSPDDPVLDFITYIGVGISMASLVICLIIEAVIWRKIRKNNTSYLRHVSIVNIAVSLLIANIWFIIGAAISEADKRDRSACSAATFFIHLFYLALFFWMFASALLLLYRTVSVFEGLSKNSMLAIGFSLGYGVPLIIAIITIAVTAPKKEYIRETPTQLSCWLNWHKSKALLAFVIPALLIVAINLIILCVVIYKMLRRRAVGDAAQAAERNVLVVIIRSLAVLTPFFGLTWGLGIGTMTNPHNRGIHGSFAFFNSLQGFFILVFGTLLDKKVRSEIAAISQSSGTRSTNAGTSSSSGLGFLRNWRRGRDGYNVSSSASGVSHSFTNM